MAQPRNRYKEMERYMTYALIADAVLFVLYLICAGSGIIWLKVILAILAIALSGLCLFFLYSTRELLRQRSLWMSACAAAVLICTLACFSLKKAHLWDFVLCNKFEGSVYNKKYSCCSTPVSRSNIY